MKSYRSNKLRFSKKSLYLAIIFVVISTAIIVAVSLKRSFSASQQGSFNKLDFSSAAVPTMDVSERVEKPYKPYKEDSESHYDSRKELERRRRGANKLKSGESSSAEIKKEEQKEEPNIENREQKRKKVAPKKKAVGVTKFLKPLDGIVIQEFSGDDLVFSKTLGEYRTHNGVDIEALPRTPVTAIFDGTVVDLFNDAGRWGTCVEIKNDAGFVAIYRGLDEEVNVKLDSKIKAGEIVGSVGNTNAFEGALNPHLHLEIKKGEDFLNPMKYINLQSNVKQSNRT